MVVKLELTGGFNKKKILKQRRKEKLCPAHGTPSRQSSRLYLTKAYLTFRDAVLAHAIAAHNRSYRQYHFDPPKVSQALSAAIAARSVASRYATAKLLSTESSRPAGLFYKANP